MKTNLALKSPIRSQNKTFVFKHSDMNIKINEKILKNKETNCLSYSEESFNFSASLAFHTLFKQSNSILFMLLILYCCYTLLTIILQ